MAMSKDARTFEGNPPHLHLTGDRRERSQHSFQTTVMER
jgi:hypothetical protein